MFNTRIPQLACLLALVCQALPLTIQLLETLFNAESTTPELLETQFPTLLFTAHTLDKMVLEFAEELPPLHPQPPPELLDLELFPLLLLSFWLSL